MQLTLCPLLLHPNSANCWKGTSPLMEPGGQWRIIWSQAQDMNNMERHLLSSHCSLIVPYEVSHGRESTLPRCSREAEESEGAWQQELLSAQSICSRPHWGPMAPAESFIFLSAVTPPPLINTCPGVSFSEAEAAFFKKALLIGGSALEGTHSSRSKCLHSSFPHPPLLSNTHKTPGAQFPWMLSIHAASFVPAGSLLYLYLTAFLFHRHYLHGLFITQE